jgi:hypothetical protein
MSKSDKECYICFKNRTKNVVGEVHICENCVEIHIKKKTKELKKEQKEKPKKEEPKKEEPPVYKLNWDGEDTEPLWSGFPGSFGYEETD